MIQRFGISRYLMFSILGLAVLTLSIFTIVTYYSNQNASQLVETTKSLDFESEKSLQAMENIVKAQSGFTGLISTNDIDELEKKYNDIKAAMVAVKKIYKDCESGCQELLTLVENYEKTYITTIEDFVFVGKKGEAVDFYINKLGPQFDKIISTSKEKQALQKEITGKTIIESESSRMFVRNLAVAGSAFLAVLLFSFGWMLRNTISQVLYDVSGKLNNSAGTVDEQLDEMVRSSEYLASSAVEQAAAVHETITIVEEMNAIFAKSADTARDSMSSSEEGKNTALSGKEIMNDMLRSFDDIGHANSSIADQLQKNTHEIQRIVKVIEEISDKTKVINDIVFQTKLLSFNASVEAARAGEHGKGFSIVAQEVGNLAEMSGQASKEISQLLSGSLQLVNGISSEMNQKVTTLVHTSSDKLKEGSERAHRCEVMFDEIVKVAQVFATDMSSIYNSTQEHMKAINEIAKAIREIDQNSQKNQTIANQTTTTVQSLAEQTANLRISIVELNSLVDGKEAANQQAFELQNQKSEEPQDSSHSDTTAA